jgi:hypothetical protein
MGGRFVEGCSVEERFVEGRFVEGRLVGRMFCSEGRFVEGRFVVVPITQRVSAYIISKKNGSFIKLD